MFFLMLLSLSVLAYQQPNAKKQRRMAEKAAKLAAMGVLPRREKLLQLRRAAAASGVSVKEKPVANNNPERPFYDLWSEGSKYSECLDLL